MSDAVGAQEQGQEEDGQEPKQLFLGFFKDLQALSNKIHSTTNVDEIMLDLAKDICDLFGCERLTLYALSDNKTSIETRFKTGLNSFKDFTLPINDKSIAGYVALYKKMVNLHDVYDDAELHLYSPEMRFMQKVDDRTGYRTKAMLANPIINAKTGELLGVLQLLNNHEDGHFSVIVEEGAKELCTTLAIAFAQRLKAPPVIRSKYDNLITMGVLSVPEMALATRAARRKQIDLEEVLVHEFKIKLSDIGTALSKFFGSPYEPYRVLRDKPHDLLKNFRREYVENNQWLLLEQSEVGVIVMTTDPDRVEGSRTVHNLFPKTEIAFCVTTNIEFKQTLDQFFGAAVVPQAGSDTEVALDTSAIHHAEAIEEALFSRVEKAITDAFKQRTDIKLDVVAVLDKSRSSLHENGSLESLSGQFVVDYRINFP